MIQLNYRDSKPIYEQIKDGMRRLILTGGIGKDEKIPSVREMAVTLSINPNTIQRAYRELEQEGYIYTISGRGSFAAEVTEVTDERKNKILEKFDESVRELAALGTEPSELKLRIEELTANDISPAPSGTSSKKEGGEGK